MQIRCMTGGAERETRLTATLEVAAGGRSGDDLLAKSKALREQLNQTLQDMEILQETLIFFAIAGDRVF